MCSELRYESEVNVWLLVYPCGCSHTAVEERGSVCGYVWMHLCVFVKKWVPGLFKHKVTSSFYSFCFVATVLIDNKEGDWYELHLQLSYFVLKNRWNQFIFVRAARPCICCTPQNNLHTQLNLLYGLSLTQFWTYNTDILHCTDCCPIKCSVEWECPNTDLK